MTLAACTPSPAERRRRRRRLGFARRTAPLAGRLARGWIRRRLTAHSGRADAGGPGFHLPLAWVEAAWGALPARACPVASVNTIVADWVAVNGRVRNTTDYFLGAGDWAPLIRATDDDPVRAEARQLREAGLVYTATAAYQQLAREIDRGAAPRRQGRALRTRADLDAYFRRFVRLYQAIEAHGMLPHHALDAPGLRYNADRALGIAVDADGTWHRLQGGNHRWAIAQVLGIETVPVELRLVHVLALPDALMEFGT